MALDRYRLISDHPPYVPIVLTIDGQSDSLTLEALIDTGFDGEVVLPESEIGDTAGVAGSLVWRLADGTAVRTDAYLAEIWIGGTLVAPVSVTVLGDEPIIGRGVTDKFAVTFDHGRRLIVDR